MDLNNMECNCLTRVANESEWTMEINKKCGPKSTVKYFK